jgi:hypothetical protein
MVISRLVSKTEMPGSSSIAKTGMIPRIAGGSESVQGAVIQIQAVLLYDGSKTWNLTTA